MFIIEVLWRQEPETDNGFPISTSLVVSDRNDRGVISVCVALNDSPDVVGIRLRDMQGQILSKNDVMSWSLSKRLYS